MRILRESRWFVFESAQGNFGLAPLLRRGFVARGQCDGVVLTIIVVPVGGSGHRVFDAKLGVDGTGKQRERDGKLELVKVQ